MKTAKFCKLCLLPDAISELFAGSLERGQITLEERYGLMAALLNNSLTEDEKSAINRLLRFVNQGRLKVVNEL
jgi:hypothetical protein